MHTFCSFLRFFYMIKFISLSFLLFCSALVVTAQDLHVLVNYVTADPTNRKPLIFYTPAGKLNWNDFKAQPDLDDEAAAVTNAGMGFRLAFHSEGDKANLNISVICNFSKGDSWVKDNRRTPYILNHEQLHFDIAYIQTMLFIQNLKAAKYTTKNFNKIIEKLYEDAQVSLVSMQTAYDTETKNSQLSEVQELWNKKVSDQLSIIKRLPL